MSKHGILPKITEKKIYFSPSGELQIIKEKLSTEKERLNAFFDAYLEKERESPIEAKIYKEMLKEYERIEHLTRCANVRTTILSNAN